MNTGLQRAYKSGACLDYFEQFGVQEDPRVRDRTRLTIKDRLALHRLNQRNAADQREARRIALVHQRAERKREQENRSKPGMLGALAAKLRSLKDKLLGGSL